MVDKAGAIEEHVNGAELVGQGSNLGFVRHIEMTGRDQRIGERRELVLGDVGRQHACAFGRKSQRRRPTDPLPRRRHQRAFAREPSRHFPHRLLIRYPQICHVASAAVQSASIVGWGQSLSKEASPFETKEEYASLSEIHDDRDWSA